MGASGPSSFRDAVSEWRDSMAPMSDFAFHQLDGPHYIPQKVATSAWKRTDISGPAVVGAVARSLEVETGVEEMQPTRLTVDLFRPVQSEPFEVRTSVVRDGNRIRVSEAELVQGGETKTRATLVQLRRAENPAGQAWIPEKDRPIPPRYIGETMPEMQFPMYFTESSGWSDDMSAHQNDQRKASWFRPIPVVSGEDASPFQRAAIVSEGTSLITNWGSEGIGFINADLTLSIARLPRSEDLGMQADMHVEADGISVGNTALYDRDGVIGFGAVVAVSNAKRQIDWSSRTITAEGVETDGRNA